MSEKQQTGLVPAPKAEMELKKTSQWHQYQYTTKDAALIIQDYKDMYKVEPKRGHLMIVESRGTLVPYITKSGHVCIANSNKISTKIAIEKITNTSVFVKCTAIRPDGTYHEAIGYSDLKEPGRDKLNKCISMATTRARNAGIDAAMEIQECGFEDFSKYDEIQKRAVDITNLQDEVLTVCPDCKERGYSRMQKQCSLCKITFEEILEKKGGH